jgi:hypothetical protein
LTNEIKSTYSKLASTNRRNEALTASLLEETIRQSNVAETLSSESKLMTENIKLRFLLEQAAIEKKKLERDIALMSNQHERTLRSMRQNK